MKFIAQMIGLGLASALVMIALGAIGIGAGHLVAYVFQLWGGVLWPAIGILVALVVLFALGCAVAIELKIPIMSDSPPAELNDNIESSRERQEQ